MSIEEFVRRLTLHTMPPCNHRIRNYGFLTNSKKNEKLKYIREKLGEEEPEKKKDKSSICKICEVGEMQTVATILGGGTVKTFEENINKLKKLPTWLSALQEIDILRNSSNIGEKMNDLIISERQKHNGMSWSKDGSLSLAGLTSLIRNNESKRWFADDYLEFKLAA